MKPLMLHGQSKLHPLLALLSILGGIHAFGPVGILVGPMLVSFLQANPAKAQAWATAHGITTDQIASYVASLTPVVLRTDTRVTNHGFVNGKANPIAAVRSAAMMLDFLGEADASARIVKAIEEPSQFTGTTAEIGDAISERV